MADDIANANITNHDLPEGSEPNSDPVANTVEHQDKPDVQPGNPSEDNLKHGNAAEGLALSDDELADARKEGAKEDVKENAKDVHHFMTDGNLPGENGSIDLRFHGWDEIQQYSFWLDRSLEELKAAGDEGAIPDNKLYGLLALERNGQNRTGYVQYLKDKLELDAGELPGGGPSYTNDTTNITDLK